jgi:hypothetical protein
MNKFAYMRKADRGYLHSIVATYRGRAKQLGGYHILTADERSELYAAVEELAFRGDIV